MPYSNKKTQKKNKEFKALYTEAYDGDYPCPNCLISGQAYEMLEDEIPHEKFWTPTYTESFDPKINILRELKGDTGLPTLYHAGTIYAGRFTKSHYFGTLKSIQEEDKP